MIINNKKIIYFSILTLALISIINLYNARLLSNFYNLYFIKQILWYTLGFLILIVNKKLFINIKLLYIIFIGLLIYILLFSKSINGSKAWLDLGIFAIQPSEFMKIIIPLYLNKILKYKKSKLYKFIYGLIITIIPSLLVFIEPDTGAIIFFIIFFICFILKLKIKLIYYLIGLLILFIILLAGVSLYKYNNNLFLKIFGTSIFYRIDRFLNFKDNYQLSLSLISIYSTEILRNGFNNILIYIPEAPTDFIFAFIVGNFGLIMIPIIFVLYLIIFEIIINKKTNYLRISFLTMFIFQILINISMNIGLIPIIGINLPFLSYGGSNLLMYFIFLKIII